jgi:hypothetical protein
LADLEGKLSATERERHAQRLGHAQWALMRFHRGLGGPDKPERAGRSRCGVDRSRVARQEVPAGEEVGNATRKRIRAAELNVISVPLRIK